MIKQYCHRCVSHVYHMFDQHELYQGVHALIVTIGILYLKNHMTIGL